MTYYVIFIVTHVNGGFEDLYFHLGDLSPFQSPDEFFRFAAEHAATNNFYPTSSFSRYIRFYKHSVKIKNKRKTFVTLSNSLPLLVTPKCITSNGKSGHLDQQTERTI